MLRIEQREHDKTIHCSWCGSLLPEQGFRFVVVDDECGGRVCDHCFTGFVASLPSTGVTFETLLDELASNLWLDEEDRQAIETHRRIRDGIARHTGNGPVKVKVGPHHHVVRLKRQKAIQTLQNQGKI